MALQRLRLSVCVMVVAVMIGASCSSKKPTQAEYATLNWVGTEVLYDATLEKRYLSLLFVLVDWCGYCKRLKSETLTDSEVIQKLGESFNIAQINAESAEEVPYMDTTVSCRYLADSTYGVRGYPTIILLDRAGELLETNPGYKPADSFLEMLDRILETY